MGVLKELEKLRGLAILAVVLIHATAPATVYYSAGSAKYLFYNAVNSLVQFAVPLFLFISCVVLSFKQAHQPEPLAVFYGKRLKGVILPYLLWSLFYALLKSWLNGQINEFFWLTRRGAELLTGTAFYHLYFLLIIMQLYLLLPWLIKLLRRLTLLSVLLSGALLQAGFYFLNKIWIYQIYPHPGNLLGSYLPIAFLGCWLGLNYRKAAARYPGPSLQAFLANLVLAGAFIFVNIRVRSGGTVDLWLYYAAYHAFVTLTGWNLLKFMELPGGESTLAKLGQHSFAIYLVHPLFLAFWERVWRSTSLFSYDTALLGGFLFAMAGSYYFGWLVSKNQLWSIVLLGR